jgi:hypothetical protein
MQPDTHPITKEEKIDKILFLLSEIQATSATQGAELIRLATCAKENKEAIKGNGKTGLETRMALQEDNTKRVNVIGAFLLLAILGDVVSRVLAR